VFLCFDGSLFGCLVYNNKYRSPITITTVRFEPYWLIEKIVTAIKQTNNICDRYTCGPKLAHPELILEYYKDRVKEFKKYEISEIYKARRLIPNFNDLVDILNA